MKYEIVILEKKDYNPKAIEIFNSQGKVVFYQGKVCPNAFAIVTRLKYFIAKDFLQQFPNAKYIVTPTTGLTHIDLEYCRQQNIKIISLKGETKFLQKITATADLSFALILSLVRHIGPAFSSVIEKGKWQRDLFRGRDLNCLILGIWGFGRLGKKLSQYAKSFDMEVLAYDNNPKAFENSSIAQSPL